ncbi:MAG TPA: hypothetical protein VF767_07695 [Bryobacteraceae bacterium]
MNLKFTGLGADRKKTAMLGGLMLILGYVFYSNVLAPSDDVPRPRTASRPAAADDAIGLPQPETRPRPPLRPGAQASRVEFKMSPRDKRPDPTTIDPTLRLDLLAKVQSVVLEGGARNLFQFTSAPLPRTPEPKIVPGNPDRPAPMVAAGGQPQGEQPKPPPPPIPLKFYGYTNLPKQQGDRRAFFLDGEEIIVAAEGQTIKNRYKVVRIGINSVVVEDTQFEHQQTLPLEEAAG